MSNWTHPEVVVNDDRAYRPRPRTLRDEFAMAAMAAMVDRERWDADDDVGEPDNVAVIAYSYADAMMKERENE